MAKIGLLISLYICMHYAGGSVVTCDARTADAIPPHVGAEFKATAAQFGFDYSTMCISNVTN